ncbi:MAG: FAD-dependent oxidoreductase [Sphingomonadales bacterium]
MGRSFVIVGSGPSGFYAAEALLQKVQDCRIDIIERMPAPFGLVRYGVAPDHEKTKNVSRAYDRVLARDEVRFFGNVEVGRDVDLGALGEAYDAVILATGSATDRMLDIPGISLTGVYGSAEFVGWYNSHPDHRDLGPDLNCRAVAIIGNGNVALDLARLLARSRTELEATDIAPFAKEAISQSPIKDIYIFGRRGPIEASFTKTELSEMGHLNGSVALVRPDQLPAALPPLEDTDYPPRVYNMKRANLEILRSLTRNEAADAAVRVHFEFLASPMEILGQGHVEGVRLERTRLEQGRAVGTGKIFDVEVGAVLSAIGYRGVAISGAPFDERRGIVPNTSGHVEDNLFVVGWAKRGPTGTIPTNRADSFAVVDQIVDALDSGQKPGRPHLEAILAQKNCRIVSHDDWKEVRAAEIAAAAPPAPRRKFATIKEMLAALD